MNNNTVKKTDIAIIGGGPAGLTAAIYGARAGRKIAIFEKLSPGGQVITTSDIENYPGFATIDGFELASNMYNQAEAHGAVFEYAEITSIEIEGNTKVLTTSEGEYQAKAVIIATGAKRRKIGVPGEEKLAGRGVSYCATCDGNFFRGKTVAVLGAGNSAFEEAVYLSRICEKVYIVHRRDVFRASKTMVDRVYKQPNIELLLNRVVVSLEGEESLEKAVLYDVRSDNVSELVIDGIFVAIGNDPSTETVPAEVSRDEAGYIITDNVCATNVPGIYAAGDVRSTSLRQIVTAAADGAVAADAADKYIGDLN